MSGKVQQVTQTFAIDTICPIVINPADAILSFKTASSIALPSPVNANFSSCHPSYQAFSDVYTESQAHRCCGVEVTTKNV
jgi:hypothetical protein